MVKIEVLSPFGKLQPHESHMRKKSLYIALHPPLESSGFFFQITPALNRVLSFGKDKSSCAGYVVGWALFEAIPIGMKNVRDGKKGLLWQTTMVVY